MVTSDEGGSERYLDESGWCRLGREEVSCSQSRGSRCC